MLTHARRTWLGAALVTTLIAGFAAMTIEPRQAVAAPQRVEVPELRTETSTTYSNPDGTFTLEQHAGPIRVKKPQGWVDIDPTLRINPDGSISPVATATPVSFSGGGDAPLATIGQPGKQLSLNWPGVLPEPALDGSTATYPEILPEVDLKVDAGSDGFSQVLVVKTREAAANPALKQLTFHTHTEGLNLSADEHGNIKAVDNNGQLVFTSPTPRMWDSSGPEADQLRNAGADLSRSRESLPDLPDMSLSTPTGARQVVMDIDLSGDRLSITPDQDLLTDPETVFPVSIDPSFTGSRTAWALARKAHPNSSFWGGDGDGFAKVGYESETGMTDRTFFVLDTVPVHGKQILSATFSIYENWAWNCNQPRPVELWLTGAISPSTTWNNQPGWLEHLGTANVAHGNNCPAANVEFDATSAAQLSADNRWPGVTLGLKASDEYDTNGWKKFDNNPVLAINYNSIPGAPTDLKVADKAAADPYPAVGFTQPTFKAAVHEPDVGDNVTTWFDIFHLEEDGTWSFFDNPRQDNLRNGDTAQVQSGKVMVHEGTYLVRSRTSDAHGFGPFSSDLIFTVDMVAPQLKPTVSSTDYGADQNETYGAAGRTGDFTFNPNGEGDIVGFKYGWEGSPTTDAPVPAGQSLTLPITPPMPHSGKPELGGLLTLFVASVDRAGHVGPIREYPFTIGKASEPAGDWKLDDPTGSGTLADASGNDHTFTINGATPGQPGRLVGGPGQDAPTAVTFDGVDDSAATSDSVVETSTSFTVATWAKMEKDEGLQTMVSAAGAERSSFFLRTDGSRWIFTVVQEDDDDRHVNLIGTSTPAEGVWTHVAGVYDAGAKEIRLYVNGVLEGTTSVEQVFEATGPLELGVDRWNGVSPGHKPWRGQLSDVQVWDRVVFAAELKPLASTLVGHWALDGDGWDSGDFRHEAEINGDVAEADDRFPNVWSAMDFDGSTGYLATGEQVLRTDNSYTITAWVNPDNVRGTWEAAVGAQHANDWSIYLGLEEGSDQWTYRVVSPGWVEPSAAANGPVANSGEWTHLAAVHDTANRQIRLYVDGALAGTTAFHHPLGSATGGMSIGQSNADGKAPWFFDGQIDDVRAYQGVLSPSAIHKLSDDRP